MTSSSCDCSAVFNWKNDAGRFCRMLLSEILTSAKLFCHAQNGSFIEPIIAWSDYKLNGSCAKTKHCTDHALYKLFTYCCADWIMLSVYNEINEFITPLIILWKDHREKGSLNEQGKKRITDLIMWKYQIKNHWKCHWTDKTLVHIMHVSYGSCKELIIWTDHILKG